MQTLKEVWKVVRFAITAVNAKIAKYLIFNDKYDILKIGGS
jgi:hypothetical protein